MEKKPVSWQRRGLFVLISQRVPPDLPDDPDDAFFEDEKEEK